MNLCSITPVMQCQLMYKESPMVMLLTHLVEKYPDYVEEALKHPEVYKILDNSLIELGGALTTKRLLEAAEKVNADEIILPDVFKDGKATIKQAKEAIAWIKAEGLFGKYKLQVVCHGNNFEEWEENFKELDSMDDIDVISIPKVTATWLPNGNRKELYYIFKNSKKEIHFLGVWYNLGELLNLGNDVWDRLRSADTCLPSLYAIQDKKIIQDRDGTINLERDYKELTEESYDLIMQEIEKEIIKSYIHICY